VSIAFPPDTDTPQLAEEMRTKPAETAAMTGQGGLWTAEAVAEHILDGVARNRFAITPGWQMTALYRFGSVIAPLLQLTWARRIARQRRGIARFAVDRE
jgi:3-dehydrosphinganine reductase